MSRMVEIDHGEIPPCLINSDNSDVPFYQKHLSAVGISNSPAWMDTAQKSDTGKPIPNLWNAHHAIAEDARYSGLFRFDLMTRSVMVMRQIPSKSFDPNDKGFPRALRDADVTAVQIMLQHDGLRRISNGDVWSAIDQHARNSSFHPVRQYLDGLRWDGVARLDGWLAQYAGVEATPYAAAVGRMTLIAMIARVFRPGCQADTMLVLVGPQGARKSTICRVLGGEWFSDALPDLRNNNKDVSQHLNGHWLIEIAEMASTDKAEAEALKSFLTRSVERYRPSYGRTEVVEPRQCCFIGTTNRRVFLRDQTGARRFWPVDVAAIDTDALRRDRDQLFAEAVVAYRANEAWWPAPDFEARFIQPQQESRFEVDAWEGRVAEFLAGKPTTTVMEVAGSLLIEVSKTGTSEQRRITAILDRLGWTRGKKTMRGFPWLCPKT